MVIYKGCTLVFSDSANCCLFQSCWRTFGGVSTVTGTSSSTSKVAWSLSTSLAIKMFLCVIRYVQPAAKENVNFLRCHLKESLHLRV